VDRRQEVDFHALPEGREWLDLGVGHTAQDAGVIHQTPETCREGERQDRQMDGLSFLGALLYHQV